MGLAVFWLFTLNRKEQAYHLREPAYFQHGSLSSTESKKLIWAAKAAFTVGNNWAFAHRNRKRDEGLWLKEQGIVLKEEDLLLKEQAYQLRELANFQQGSPTEAERKGLLKQPIYKSNSFICH